MPAALPTSTAPPATATPGTSTSTVPKPTTTAPRPPLPADALWPKRHLAKSFSTPHRAVEDFARYFLFMQTPNLGPAQIAGDEARISIRALPTAGLTTIVTVRRVATWGWVVVGCAAPTIQIDGPASGATVDSPLTIRGRAHTYEGNVDLTLVMDPEHSLGRSFGTGGGDEMRPFEATITFPAAAVRDSVDNRPTPVFLVAREPRADDGAQGPLVATVVRLTL
jgi:hypothetical protein